MTNDSTGKDGSNHRLTDIVIALSVGLLVGVAGALLFAPASGRDTRRRIGRIADGIADKSGALAHRATGALKDPAGRVEQAISEGKQAYRQAQENRTS